MWGNQPEKDPMNTSTYRPRLGELATLHPAVDAHAGMIEKAFTERFGDFFVQARVAVEGVPNWYSVRHCGGIVVNGHIISRGGTSGMHRVFYIQRTHGWEELTDVAQFAV